MQNPKRRANLVGLSVIAAESALIILALQLVSGGMEWRGATFLFLVIDAILSSFAFWLWSRPRAFRIAKQYLTSLSFFGAGLLIALVAVVLGVRAEPLYWFIALCAIISLTCVAGFARLRYLERSH